MEKCSHVWMQIEIRIKEHLKHNTHRRRKRDETVLSRRVGVGGVYWASVIISSWR